MAAKQIPLNKIKHVIATGLGSGYSPFAPGTAGSLVALILYIVIPIDDYIWLAVTIITFFIGIWVSNAVEREQEKDPPIIVIDEIVGQWVALLFLPRILWIFLAAFLLFRILDIIKPFPAADMEDFEGGAGIMLDDIIAGFYTNLALHLTIIFIT